MASVLIIDDAAFARRMIRKFLQADGYEILEAMNGAEGLEIIHKHQPDCVLTDILMPDCDGLEFLQTLQKQSIRIPTIIITADIQESTRNLSLELGATAFINKPVKENEVRQTVRKVFASLGADTNSEFQE